MAKDQILEIRVPDLEKVQWRLKSFQEKAPSLISKSINRTITHVKKVMATEAREVYIVKSSDVKATLRYKKASARVMYGEAISASAEKVNLYDYKTSPRKPNPKAKRYFKARVMKKGNLKPLPGKAADDRAAAFVATMKSGHTGIFERVIGKPVQKSTDRTDRRKNSRWGGFRDYAITEMKGPAIPQLFTKSELSKAIQKDGSDFLHKTLEHEIKWALEASK